MADLKWVYFSSKGRIARLPYFLYGFAIGAIVGVFAGVLSVLEENSTGAQAAEPGGLMIAMALLFLVMAVASIFCHFNLMIKRLHDVDKSGWLSLISLIPIVGFIFYLYLLFAKGTAGTNRFGNPPV